MRKAASLGFAVAKPWGDSDRYDVVARSDKNFWRVQIKSVLGLTPSRPHFVVQTKNSKGKAYSREDMTSSLPISLRRIFCTFSPPT